MKNAFSGRLRAALITSLTLTQMLSPQALASKGLSERDLINNASSRPLEATAARVLSDNNESFQAKLAAIRSAKKTLRLAYYIYSDDYSSSVFSKELLAAAKRGVKVELLVDFLTNYKFADLFSAMESESGGKIRVYLYNVPNQNVQRFAEFLGSDCSLQAKENKVNPKACSDEKVPYVNQAVAKGGSFFGKMALAGLSAKSGTALQVAVGVGGNLAAEKARLAAGPKTTPETRKKLFELLELIIDGKIKKDTLAMFQLATAMTLYADDVNPIYNLVTGRFPIDTGIPNLGRDVMHLTDFLHHKILLADDKELIVGGRNIEDSYHMTPEQRSLLGEGALAKYTFQDTDFYGQIKQTGKSTGIREAYDRLIGFKEMVKPLSEVLKVLPIELVQNAPIAAVVAPQCEAVRASQSAFDSCVAEKFTAANKPALQTRITEQLKIMNERAEVYSSTFSGWSGPRDMIAGNSDTVTDRAMKMTYIENLPFPLTEKNPVRRYGVSNFDPTASGKNIHALIDKSLRQACDDSRSLPSGQKLQVNFYQGYVLFSTDILHTFGNMINSGDGFKNCRKVQIDIITNSIETTDLNPINFVARHQLKALLEYSKKRTEGPSFRIFELAKRNPLVSLHSKVNIIGNDIIIGSANMDVRSYYMDTNNGVYITNAPGLVSTYNAYLNAMKADPAKVVDVTDHLDRITLEELKQEDRMILTGMIQYFENKKPRKRLLSTDTEMMNRLHFVARKILDKTYLASEDALNFTERLKQNENRPSMIEPMKREQIRIEDSINELLMVL